MRLSSRLLLLTIFFVLLAEILIFVPSVARFRRDWLQDKANQAYLIALAARAAPSGMLTPDIEREVIERLGITQMRVTWPQHPGSPIIHINMPEPAAAHNPDLIDLYQHGPVRLMGDALGVLWHQQNRMLTLNAMPTGSLAMVTLVLHEQPLAKAARDFGVRIFWLSLIISIIAGGLVFLSLNRILVRPIRHLTASMIAFRANPEAETPILISPRHTDEIGQASIELRYMQNTVRDALHQKTRLAMLGTGLTKINHDLRNILSTAALLSERLATSQDHEVQSIAPRLEKALTRAIGLCEDTLAYARDGRIPIRAEACDLGPLLRDVGAELADLFTPVDWQVIGANGWVQSLDPEQFARVIRNLGQNALQAGANHIKIEATPDRSELHIIDNGPGLPPRAREFLFVPFAATARAGGTGLGLALARDIMRAHGGDLVLGHSDASGTGFIIRFAKLAY